MKIDKLNRLLDEGVLTQEEYDSFFDTMHVNENGQLVGIVQTKNPATHKYNLEGDLLNGDLVEFVKTKITPPYEAEDMDEVFKTYGVMVTGIADYWHWFTRDNITEYALSHGHKPIEEASELELWKMIAICERYWEVFYSDCYHDRGEN